MEKQGYPLTFRRTVGILSAASMLSAVCSTGGVSVFAASFSKSDAVTLKNWLTTASPSQIDGDLYDLNEDGQLDARDLALLKQSQLTQEAEPAYVHLNGNSITYEGEHISVNGSTATISASGTYYLNGKLSNGQVIVNVSDEVADAGTVKLFLDGVEMTNASAPCILIENAENTSVNLVENTQNSLSDGKDAPASEVEPAFAVLEAKDDMTIKGEGSLSIHGGEAYGIHCNNDLKINGGQLTVDTGNSDAIRGRTSVKIKDGSIHVDSEGDGVKSTKGAIEISGGTLDIRAGNDALQSETTMELTGGKVRACGDRGLTAGESISLDGCTILATATDEQCANLENTVQPALQISFTKQWSKNNPLTLTDSGKIPIFDENTLKKYRYAVISSPEMENGKSYGLWAGGIAVAHNGQKTFAADTPAAYTDVNNTDHAELLYSDSSRRIRYIRLKSQCRMTAGMISSSIRRTRNTIPAISSLTARHFRMSAFEPRGTVPICSSIRQARINTVSVLKWINMTTIRTIMV